MKKQYLKPEMTIFNLQVEAMMAESMNFGSSLTGEVHGDSRDDDDQGSNSIWDDDDQE